jgi:outer membrane protein
MNGRRTRRRTEAITVEHRVLHLSNRSRFSAAASSSLAQDAAYEAALQHLATRVVTAYFAVLVNEDALSVVNAMESALAWELKRASVRLDVGLSTLTDVQNARALHDTSIAAIATTKNALADSREALRQITGRPANDLKKLGTLPTDLALKDHSEASTAQAGRSSPRIVAAQYSVESAEHDVASARADYLPTIDVFASYSRTVAWTRNPVNAANAGHRRGVRRAGFAIGLTLKIPLFPSATRRMSVRHSIYRRDAAQEALKAIRREVVRDAHKHHRSAFSGASKVAATEAAVESSERLLYAARGAFDIGRSTMIDVLRAQQNLTQALMNHSKVRHQFVLDKLLLTQVVDRVGMKDIEAINLLLQ